MLYRVESDEQHDWQQKATIGSMTEANKLKCAHRAANCTFLDHFLPLWIVVNSPSSNVSNKLQWIKQRDLLGLSIDILVLVLFMIFLVLTWFRTHAQGEESSFKAQLLCNCACSRFPSANHYSSWGKGSSLYARFIAETDTYVEVFFLE